jgi:transcriptional repressor NrdR
VESGISAAAKGRGISDDAISAMASDVEEAVRVSGSVVPATQIGVAVLEQLRIVDEVAYLRFASVYKEFDGAADFHREIELLTKQPRNAESIS